MPSSLQLRVQRVSFSYSDLVLLDDVSFACRPGWVGVVGANGSGKSTVLQLISRELVPTSGQIVIDGGGEVIRWHQRVDALADEVRGVAEATDGQARRLLGQLKLKADQLDRWATLSPGERTRWQCAAALHRDPDVLLLDEPTNHLDSEARALLLEALGDFRGIGLIVSHDRPLLDALTTATVRLVDGQAHGFPQPYSAARRSWTDSEARALEQHTLKQRSARATQQRLHEAQLQLEAATRNRSTGRRMKNASDSDARTLAADTRAAHAEQAHASRQHRIASKLEHLESSLNDDALHFARGTHLHLEAAPCPNPLAAKLHQTSLYAGLKLILAPVDFDVPREAHLSLEGPNGAGKSTLVRALRDACTLPDHAVWWLTQDEPVDEAEQLLARLRALPRVERGRTLQWVDCLGANPEHVLRSKSLSPGEARKLRLAFGLSTPRALLILDEPTNHLDLPSIERLQTALREFTGALVLVSHDSLFAQACCDARWRLDEGRLTERRDEGRTNDGETTVSPLPVVRSYTRPLTRKPATMATSAITEAYGSMTSPASGDSIQRTLSNSTSNTNVDPPGMPSFSTDP